MDKLPILKTSKTKEKTKNQKITNFFSTRVSSDTQEKQSFFGHQVFSPSTALAEKNYFLNSQFVRSKNNYSLVDAALIFTKTLLTIGENHDGSKVKFIQHFDSLRPPFHGTKTCRHCLGTLRQAKRSRHRLSCKKIYEDFDYEYDSENEWENVSDAEDISSGTSDRTEEQDEQSELNEDEWLVPHGYLSEDEREIDAGMGSGIIEQKSFTDTSLTQLLSPFSENCMLELLAGVV